MIPQQLPDPGTVRETLRAVLEREGIPEAPPEPSALQRWIAGLLERLLGDLAEGPGLERLLLVGLGVALGALLVAWLWRFLPRGERDRRRGVRLPSVGVQRKMEALRRQAREAEGRGELVLALRLLLFCLVVGLAEDGELEFHPAWTDRELLERGEVASPLRERLSALFDEHDPMVFGDRPVSDRDLRRLEELGRALLAGEVT